MTDSECDDVALKPLCPTRWTARTGAIGAVISDYSILIETLVEVHQTTRDEYGMKAGGLLSALDQFSTLFGLKLFFYCLENQKLYLSHCRGKTQHYKKLSSVNLAVAFYQRQRIDDSFSQFYKSCIDMALEKMIIEPKLP